VTRSFFASYIIDERADFLGRQQHVAFLGGIDHIAIADDSASAGTGRSWPAAKARDIKLGNPEQAKINRAEAAARAQALRPHIERCIKVGRTSSSAIATDLNARGIAAPNGGQWFPMQVRRVRHRLGLLIDRGLRKSGVKQFPRGRG
jgi:hypothetical protein